MSWTDNALIFTMRFSAHPERQTVFQKTLMELGLIDGKSAPGKPWQNGFIERSNRTDNENCFQAMRFVDSEERRYQHRLWEMHYNHHRPHQGLHGLTPLQVYRRDYVLHAQSRMLL